MTVTSSQACAAHPGRAVWPLTALSAMAAVAAVAAFAALGLAPLEVAMAAQPPSAASTPSSPSAPASQAAAPATSASVVPPAPARNLHGETFPGQAKVGAKVLQLNGVGVRAVAFIKGYIAGLYVPRTSDSAEALLAQREGWRVELRMRLSVPPEEFIKAIDKGVERHLLPAQQQSVAGNLSALHAQLQAVGKVKDGDLVWLDEVPGTGLQISLNRKPIGQAIGDDLLARAVLSVFIGAHPTDQRLKKGLLGQPT